MDLMTLAFARKSFCLVRLARAARIPLLILPSFRLRVCCDNGPHRLDQLSPMRLETVETSSLLHRAAVPQTEEALWKPEPYVGPHLAALTKPIRPQLLNQPHEGRMHREAVNRTYLSCLAACDQNHLASAARFQDPGSHYLLKDHINSIGRCFNPY
jgi:hypothetical protein